MNYLLDHHLGHATLEPQTAVVAGRYGTWTLTYTVGSLGIDSNGQVKIARRLVSDWGDPQFDEPQAEGYSTAVTDGAAKLRVSWQERGYIRPKNKAIVVDIYDGSLSPGDTITITLGDRRYGSPGLRAQTYIESRFEFLVLVDPTNSCDPRPIAVSPTVAVVADEIEQLVCLLPSQAALNEPVEVFLKGEDKWRNPTPAPADVQLEWVGTGEVELENGMLIARKAGSGYLLATAGQLSCRSNPLIIHDDMPASPPLTPPNTRGGTLYSLAPLALGEFKVPPPSPPELGGIEGGRGARGDLLKRYWGDLHAQTAATVGVGSEDEYFTFGREWARLDFMSHQGNDFQITDEYWQHLNETTKRYHQDGQFVVFPGYEWSAGSPTGGDHNVFYRREGHPILRSSHWLVPHIPATDITPAHPADVFYDKLKEVVPLDEVIVAMHVGGRYANLLDYFDQELITLVELVSCWGVFEWMLWDAFDKGYIVGVMCNSDGHNGRPGAEGSGMTEFGTKNGLTCVLSEALTRDSIFDALKNRQCYGTTGARILLDFTAGAHQMGSVLTQPPFDPSTLRQAQGTAGSGHRKLRNQDEPIELQATVTGTAPLESLQLFCGKEIIQEVRPAAFDNLTRSNHIRVSWQGSRERGRMRRVTWDGELRAEGCHILSADLFSFDVIADGIISQTPQRITFGSKTTGDRDGFDLILDDARHGTLIFDSAAGKATVNLANLTDTQPRQTFDFGGVDMQLIVERYPAQTSTLTLTLTQPITPPPRGIADCIRYRAEWRIAESKKSEIRNPKSEIPPSPPGKLTPYLAKATQIDGQMAWASPIYFDNR